MPDFLSSLMNLSVLVFVVTSMLSVGLRYTLQQIIEPLRNARLVILALVANFVLVPLLAFAVMRFLSLDQPLAIGLFLIASAAGAPFALKLTHAAGGNLALSAGLLVLLLLTTVVYLPLVVPLALPAAPVSATSIATPLVWTMLLPLGIGLVVAARAPTWAERLQPILGPVSTVALVLLFVTTVLVNFGAILGVFGTGAILAALLVISGAFAIGYLLGGLDNGTRGVLGLTTAQRNIAAATVVATQSVGFADTLVMVVITSVVGMAILFPVASALRKRAARAAVVDAENRKRTKSPG